MGIPRTDNPKVIAHIQAQRLDEKRQMYGCGCLIAKDDTIMLCQWHDGYDEGLADAAAEQRARDEAIIDYTVKRLLGHGVVSRGDIDAIIAAAEQGEQQ